MIENGMSEIHNIVKEVHFAPYLECSLFDAQRRINRRTGGIAQ